MQLLFGIIIKTKSAERYMFAKHLLSDHAIIYLWQSINYEGGIIYQKTVKTAWLYFDNILFIKLFFYCTLNKEEKIDINLRDFSHSFGIMIIAL